MRLEGKSVEMWSFTHRLRRRVRVWTFGFLLHRAIGGSWDNVRDTITTNQSGIQVGNSLSLISIVYIFTPFESNVKNASAEAPHHLNSSPKSGQQYACRLRESTIAIRHHFFCLLFRVPLLIRIYNVSVVR